MKAFLWKEETEMGILSAITDFVAGVIETVATSVATAIATPTIGTIAGAVAMVGVIVGGGFLIYKAVSGVSDAAGRFIDRHHPAPTYYALANGEIKHAPEATTPIEFAIDDAVDTLYDITTGRAKHNKKEEKKTYKLSNYGIEKMHETVLATFKDVGGNRITVEANPDNTKKANRETRRYYEDVAKHIKKLRKNGNDDIYSEFCRNKDFIDVEWHDVDETKGKKKKKSKKGINAAALKPMPSIRDIYGSGLGPNVKLLTADC